MTSGPGSPGGPGGWGGDVTVRYTEAVGRELAETMVPADRMYLVGGEGGAGGRGGVIWHRQERVQEGGVVFYYTNEGRSPDGPHGESGSDGRVLYLPSDRSAD